MNEAHVRFLRSHPPPELVRAVMARIEPRARVVRVTRLKGGIDTSTHRIDLEARGGARRAYVLRRYSDEPWSRPEQDWARLGAVQRVPVPVPEPVLLDDRLMVTTALPGRSWLTPSDPLAWADGMAVALAGIHGTPFPERDRWRNDWVESWRMDRPEVWTSPRGRRLRAALPAALDVIGSVAQPDVLRHNDYWAGNTLWHRGRLSGVVDWGSAAFGPALFDVAYWRLDTAVQRGPELVSRFAATYARATGQPIDDRLMAAWDLAAATRALPDPDPWVHGWVELGRRDVTVAAARRRLTAFIGDAARRLR